MTGFGRQLSRELKLARTELREGRFERSMALMTAFAAIVSGWEAYAQHLRGAFSHWLMWTPVGLTPPTVMAATAALVSDRAARSLLPVLAIASFVDGVVGFVFHLRGINRMPGGWRLGQYNVVMGPPMFAPLLTCTEEDGEYGERVLERMQDYNHYAAIGVLGEILPDERNLVSLHPTVKDRYGLPVAYSHFNLFDNDRRMMQAGISRARAVLEAAGAIETHAVNRYAHLVGTCRMGSSQANSVVDRWCRSWEVPNLLVCDGSVLPTQGSANPAITISALAARTADWLRRAVPAGELRSRQRSKSEVYAA